jgi:hypothetical protein
MRCIESVVYLGAVLNMRNIIDPFESRQNKEHFMEGSFPSFLSVLLVCLFVLKQEKEKTK